MATIFDLLQSAEIASYWDALSDETPIYAGESLFPADKKRGLGLQWIKGSQGLPIALKTSAFDVASVPRARIGFEKLSAQMPYFKESTYIDEELRQELNMVLETGNQAYIDSVMNRVFDDEARLLKGASAIREAMRMQALTTGMVTLTGTDQIFTFDYGIPEAHKFTVTTSWSDSENSDPLADIQLMKDTIISDTGYTVTRAICNSVTWRNLKNNKKLNSTIYILANGQAIVSDSKLKSFLLDEMGIDVVIDDQRYVDSMGNAVTFVPDNVFVVFPDGDLGKTWFGTTPAESDLMGGSVANVSITDTGVAITTVNKADPVQVETIVSQICLPSFEMADAVGILDTEPETE